MVNNEFIHRLKKVTQLLLFRDATSLWPFEFSSNNDVFELTFNFPVEKVKLKER